MATRKEKHAAALKKREEYFEQLRVEGLQAIQREKARKERESYHAWIQRHMNNHVPEMVDWDGCPWCKDGVQVIPQNVLDAAGIVNA